MAKRPKTGKCHICGKEGPLSYEHVPPASAFNNEPARVFNAMQILGRADKLPWEIDEIKSIEQQRGRGGYTLCEDCNRYTGFNYAKDYVQAARCTSDARYTHYIHDRAGVEVVIDSIHPLRFAKQILAMFASINNPHIFEVQTQLRELVLDKEARGIDTSKYAIYLYYFKEGLGRNIGIAAMGDLATSVILQVSELSAPPFGAILEFNPRRDQHGIYGAEITDMLNDFGYHDKDNITLRMPIYEQNTPVPCDFRTREEIVKRRNESLGS